MYSKSDDATLNRKCFIQINDYDYCIWTPDEFNKLFGLVLLGVQHVILVNGDFERKEDKKRNLFSIRFFCSLFFCRTKRAQTCERKGKNKSIKM